MEILRIPRKGVQRAAFSEGLMCPRRTVEGVCGGTKFKFVEHVGGNQIRYRCKKCGKTLRYDYSNNPMWYDHLYGNNTKSIIEKAKQLLYGRDKPQR